VTIYTSQMISGMVGQQLGMFQGYGGYAQQINPMGMHPGMMPQMGAIQATRQGMGGVYGEQAAQRMANVGQTAMNVGTAGLGVLSAFSPIPLDPFSGGMMGMMRGGIGGGLMGAGAGAVAALPLFAAAKTAQVYGGAFMGGMQDQAALNSSLRNNFQHFGGQGAFGRGFSQSQMGQIGSMVSGEIRRNPFTSNQELSGLIAGGAEAGQFTAVRDVQQFTQKFRQMLNTLKDVQRELGGTLTDALQFVRGAQQSGIFRNADQVNFAAEVRSAEAVTGMDRNQLVALSAQGAQVSRAFGGLGRQGAMGALRGAQTIGAAVQSGAINQEMLSEATGGLQGAEAIGAFTTNMLQRSGQFSRRGMGRFSLFALSNAEGTGLDSDMLARFNAGDLSTGDVSRAAHGRVRGMGRARALNREGMLRGAVMEQGGMAAQIGMMRLMVGDRVLDQGDDMASLVMQRRFHMQRPEAELMTSLMRNQGRIAEQQALDSGASRRQTMIQRDITENRSVDAFTRQLGHSVQESLGINQTRELGRSFVTKLSALAERAMNDILGATSSAMSQGDHQTINRMMMGRLGAGEAGRLTVGSGIGAAMGGDMFGERPAAQQLMHSLGFHTQRTNAEVMEARGVHNFRRMDNAAQRQAMQTAMSARAGAVRGGDFDQFQSLEGDANRTIRRIQTAQLLAGEGGNLYQFMGGTGANATDAFMARHRMTGGGPGVDEASMLMAGRGSRLSLGMIGRDLGRLAMGGALGGLAGGALGFGGLESMEALRDRPEENRISFIARGGHLGANARRVAARGDVSYQDAQARLSSGRYAEAGRGERNQIEGALMAQHLRVDEDSLRAVMGTESIRERLRSMSGMRGEALTQQMDLMRTDISRFSDPRQQQAALSMVAQMDRNIRRTGRVGREFNPALSDEERQRQTELVVEYQRRGQMLQGVGEDVGGHVGRLFQRAAGRLSSAGEGFGERDAMGVSDDMASARSALARLDPSSDRYRQISRRLARGDDGRPNEDGQAFLASIAHERQQRRALSGRGRRGRSQAVEEAFSMVTGGSLSEMEFTVGPEGRQRTISGGSRNAAQQLAREMRGSNAGDIRAQLVDQLTANGMAPEDAERMYGTLAQSLASGQGRGVGNIDELIRSTGTGQAGQALDRIRQQGVERQQRARDPIAFDSLQTLRSIDSHMQRLREQIPGGMSSPPTGEAA
jgi:hypothetical protein